MVGDFYFTFKTFDFDYIFYYFEKEKNEKKSPPPIPPNPYELVRKSEKIAEPPPIPPKPNELLRKIKIQEEASFEIKKTSRIVEPTNDNPPKPLLFQQDILEQAKCNPPKPPPIPPKPNELLRKIKMQEEASFEIKKTSKIVEPTNDNPPKPLPRKKKNEIPIPEPHYKVIPSAPPFEDEEDLCKICMINELECVFYDCGHMISCMNCYIGLTRCPVCQNSIIQPIRVFK